MDAARIEQIRKSKEKARQRQWQNYQATGDDNYYRKMNGYEDIVTICDQALSAADALSPQADRDSISTAESSNARHRAGRAAAKAFLNFFPTNSSNFRGFSGLLPVKKIYKSRIRE